MNRHCSTSSGWQQKIITLIGDQITQSPRNIRKAMTIGFCYLNRYYYYRETVNSEKKEENNESETLKVFPELKPINIYGQTQTKMNTYSDTLTQQKLS